MASPSPLGPSSPGSPAAPNLDTDGDNTPANDMPLTMAQSVILTALPKDTTEALEAAGDLGVEKGVSVIS